MRARLLLAFVAIAAFAVLGATAGIYASRQVGDRLASVDRRIPPTLMALELSRSAERIIAAAPGLLAANDRTQRDDVNARLQTEVVRLNSALVELQSSMSGSFPLDAIEATVSALTINLGGLEDLVARRLDTRERLSAAQQQLFETNNSVQRLLAPWLQVIDGQISQLIAGDAYVAGTNGVDDQPAPLTSLIALQRLTQTAQRQVSAMVDMLADASTTEQSSRLPVLAFQMRLALRELDTTAAGLDDRLQPLLTADVERLRALVDGPNAIAETREQELELVRLGEQSLAETARLSAQLTTAIDELGSAARQDIAGAIQDALAVQRLSSRTLIVLAALSLITSLIIVWFYVGRSIVRRLTLLSDGMLAIAGGRLDEPMSTQGRDEIAGMGRAVEVFRHNAIELERLLKERELAATRLERAVEERTRELAEANRYKARFLAAASHDLRQPLHALNLFVDQFGSESDPNEQTRLVGRIHAAVASMNDLFDVLLDMSKLEAGLLKADIAAFRIRDLLTRIESTFVNAATEKGLRLVVVQSSTWIRSDFILLERILLNLVSNAVRHTARGGVVVGCRRRGRQLRIDVCDSGPGIPKAEQAKVFGEFYRITDSERDRHSGFGLGLSIVERLGRLLEHPLELSSRPDQGSRFSISVPLAEPAPDGEPTAISTLPLGDPVKDKFIVVVDDDPLVLESMLGRLRGWGYRVATAQSDETVLEDLAEAGDEPDLIISDLRLAGAVTGIDAIARLRGAFGKPIPALLISGDTSSEWLRKADESGLDLLRKPVSPMRLRSMILRLLNPGSA